MASDALKLDWCPHKGALYAVRHWHYSKTLPVPPHVKIGVWEGGEFVGCVIFSRGASPSLANPYGLTQTEACELTRVALKRHRAPVSRIVAIALAMLKRSNPGLRLVISFADPNYGHVGGIYQAGNWLYFGQTAKGKEYWHAGRRLHSRQVSAKGFNTQYGNRRKVLTPAQCHTVTTEGKYRYLMPLDEDTRKRLAPLAKPYPKRAKKQDSVHHTELGGAVPTRALQPETGE